MVTAESIIAKIVSFIVGKTTERLAKLTFDKRRKACRALTKLYYCVQTLDETTDQLLRAMDSADEKRLPSAIVNALHARRRDIELASNMFIQLGNELYGGLQIIDPALAECCHTLYSGKMDFLSFMSNSVRFERGDGKAVVIVKKPLGNMESVNLDELYSVATSRINDKNLVYWPDTALDYFDEDFEEVSLTFSDDGGALEIKDMIVAQNLVLKVAKERLRELIKNSFSVEEVLFQSDSHPYR